MLSLVLACGVAGVVLTAVARLASMPQPVTEGVDVSSAYRSIGKHMRMPLAALPEIPPQKVHDPDKVRALAALMRRPGTVLPPISVARTETGYLVLDGFSRIAAARSCRKLTHNPGEDRAMTDDDVIICDIEIVICFSGAQPIGTCFAIN